MNTNKTIGCSLDLIHDEALLKRERESYEQTKLPDLAQKLDSIFSSAFAYDPENQASANSRNGIPVGTTNVLGSSVQGLHW